MQGVRTMLSVGSVLILLGCLAAYLMGANMIGIMIIAPFSLAALWLMTLTVSSSQPEPLPDFTLRTKQAVDLDSLTALLQHPDFDRVLCGMPMPALVIADARVMAANPPALELLGHHILGIDVRSAIRHPAAAERLANPIARSNGSVTDLVGLGRGNQRWEMRTVPLSAESRLVLLQDQSALATAERMRSDFVANASHELRTPLAAISGFIETLQDESAGGDPATRHRFLSVIDAEARRMQILVDDLISLSRIEAVKYQTPEDTVDLAEIIRRVRDELSTSNPARAADIQLHNLDIAVLIKADAAQMSQLFHNLLGNAMKYGRPDTAIDVNLSYPRDDMVQVLVKDQGDGIAEEHLPRLTERFYRVDSARSRALGGTGLGLSIVKHIVERHKGRLDISSQQGKGAQVSILLPLN